jgi:Heparinase II/III-like protein
VTRYPVDRLVQALRERPFRAAVTLDELRRARAEPALANLIAELREGAAQSPPTQPSWSLYRRFAETGERTGYESVYFGRRAVLSARLAMAALDSASIAALADVLWDVCDEYTWALPAHEYLIAAPGRTMPRNVDLFSAETAHALAEAVALLGSELPPPVTNRVRGEIHRRVLAPLFDDPRPWAWEGFTNNWAAVCAGAAGMAALALDCEPLWLAGALDRCLRAMEVFLSGITEDGGCTEGVDYWVYGFGYFAYFTEALRGRTGFDLLRDTPNVAAFAAFPAAAQLAPASFVSFSDSSPDPMIPTGLLSHLRSRLDVRTPLLAAVPAEARNHCHRWAHLSRTLAWTTPGVLSGICEPGTVWLPAAQWLITRTADGIALAAKGGHNDEPHNHLDLGHFILAASGEQLLADLGAGVYDRDYFGAGRYAYLHPSAEGHSVPIVDGVLQQAGPRAAAVARYEDGILALDLSAAYGREVRRTLAFQGGTLILRDSFPGASSVQELFISRVAPALPGPGVIRWPGREATATLHYPATSWRATIEELDGASGKAYRTRLTSAGEIDADFRITVGPRPG